MEQTVEESVQVSWYQDAMKKGLILGIVHIFIFLIVYYLAPNKLAGFSYLAAILVINIGYCIYQGIEWRKGLGGFMSYGAAFKHCFILLLTNGIIFQIFTALFLFIEPALPDVMAQAQLDVSIYWAQKFGAPEATVDQMRSQFKPEDVTDRYGPLGLLTGIGIVAIFYAIGAVIVAFITRKNEPMEM